jgi:hypothetical protein
LRFLVFICLWGASVSAQTAAQAAPPTPKLSGFPFQDETLRYSIRWPSGLNLGEAVFSARHGASGWSFDSTIDASIPAFPLHDAYRANATDALCSLDFDRSFTHGSKKSREKTTFDAHNRRATRVTTLPPDGGKSDFDIAPCARDAVTFLYFARREMGQGRVAPQETVYFGGGYTVRLQYTGEMSIPVRNKPTVTDHVVVSIKGPRSDATAEVFFARDAARTPLLVKVPLTVGTVSVELVR